jgi:hypothetical protein
MPLQVTSLERTMQQINRGRRGADGWREVLARFAQSGLRTRAFCDREGISTASFYRWRSILEGSPQKPRSPKPSMAADSTTGFVDLGALSTSGPRFEVRLDLGGGVLLHLVRG